MWSSTPLFSQKSKIHNSDNENDKLCCRVPVTLSETSIRNRKGVFTHTHRYDQMGMFYYIFKLNFLWNYTYEAGLCFNVPQTSYPLTLSYIHRDRQTYREYNTRERLVVFEHLHALAGSFVSYAEQSWSTLPRCPYWALIS